tara:strand:- start:356 stop:598 length:243 start_codon:yes stop_codon:yes gene_type:complete
VSRKAKGASFEKALEEFEKLVESMEEGELSLEESVKKYERGMELARICQTSLDEAEQRIKILSEKTGALEPMDEPADEDE